jgi:hypothetical protein
MNNPDLKKIFYELQKQMIQKLSSDRKIIFHPTAKGDASELNWIEWLKNYLPRRYEVDKAFVIDSNNRFSEQLDLVIYDRQFSPFVFNQDGAIYIPAECVYAVFEVKQELNKENLLYAAEKIKSVRLLNRTSAAIVHAGGHISDPKPPLRILGGILTLASGWVDTFGESFQTIVSGLSDHEQIDMGCVLEKASFTIDYLESSNSKELSTDQEALIYFFLKLLMKLQKLGTVPAMDIEAYARALNSI